MKRIAFPGALLFFWFLFANIALADIDQGLVAYYPFNGNADDESGNGNHGTAYGASLSTDRNGNRNSAYYFDGIDDYIDIGSNSSMKPSLPVTISAWVYLGNSLCENAFTFLNCYNDNIVYGVELVAQSDAIAVHFYSGGTGAGYRRTKIRNTVLEPLKWYHVTGVIRGAQSMELYLDGINAGGSYEGSGGDLAYSNGSGTVGKFDSSGSDFYGPYFFSGKADEIRFYNRALTATEIQYLYEYSPEYIYYLPYFKRDTEMATGMGIRNLNDSHDASIVVDIFDEDGLTLATEDQTIPARGQKAWMVGRELSAEGWIRVKSDQPLGGLCFLSYGLDYMADIPMTDALSTELVVPHVGQSEDWDTAIYVCNPNDVAVEVGLTFVNAEGSPRITRYFEIPANGSGKYFLEDLLQGEAYINGSVEISADNKIAAFALYYNQKTGGGCFSGINAIDKK